MQLKVTRKDTFFKTQQPAKGVRSPLSTATEAHLAGAEAYSLTKSRSSYLPQEGCSLIGRKGFMFPAILL